MASQAAETAPATAGAEQTSTPVEMNSLPTSTTEQSTHPVDQVDPAQSMATTSDAAPAASSPAPAADPSSSQPQPSSSTDAPLASSSAGPAQPTLTRQQTEALGPAVDNPALTSTSTNSGPTLSITLMLTTGARHPYKIDEKYLKNRNADPRNSAGELDPLMLSGYQLKELIHTDWRSEWEPRPSSPSFIRLIIWGKMVEDKMLLSDYNFKHAPEQNVVHMTIKPADFGEDEDTAAKHTGKGGSIRARDGGEGGAGCRCVIL